MSFALETDDLLATTIYGELVTIVRNTPVYGDAGDATDFWATVASVNGDIQPLYGAYDTVLTGQARSSTQQIFLPDGTDVREGDHIRPSGWVSGDDEYSVDYLNHTFDGHVDVLCSLVVGDA